MTVGDASMWSDIFPGELVPRIIDLVIETWKAFPSPAADEKEVPITRRFKVALKHAKDYNRLPLRIEREMAEDDLLTAEELGRIDLKFSPAMSAREEVYFAFECKRLYAFENGTRRPRAAEYVMDGMLRFVTGNYSSLMRHGGMIGYVLDGQCDIAIVAVEQNIENHSQELRMSQPARFERSSIRPALDTVRETSHYLLSDRLFCLHHLFLAGASDDSILLASPPSDLKGTGKRRNRKASTRKKQTD